MYHFCFVLPAHFSWLGQKIQEKISHCAIIVYFWLYRTMLNPDTGKLSYRERELRTGTRCTGMKGARGSGCTCSLSHKNTDTHKGRLDVHRREAVCLMPVFFCQRCSEWGRVGGGGGSGRRMKAGAEQCQLRTTAAGEVDRREWRGKDPHWRDTERTRWEGNVAGTPLCLDHIHLEIWKQKVEDWRRSERRNETQWGADSKNKKETDGGRSSRREEKMQRNANNSSQAQHELQEKQPRTR